MATLVLTKAIIILAILVNTTHLTPAHALPMQDQGKQNLLFCVWVATGQDLVGAPAHHSSPLCPSLSHTHTHTHSSLSLICTGLGDNIKGRCPPGHISECRYIVMMHPLKRDPDQVTIASAGTSRTTTTTTATTQPAEDLDWFKLLSLEHAGAAGGREGEGGGKGEGEGGSSNLKRTTNNINSRTVGDLVWYSATMDPTTAEQILQQQHKHRIKYLVPDLPVQMYGRVQKHPPSWGLDRIDQRTDKLDGFYHYPRSAGQNITIYIIDT